MLLSSKFVFGKSRCLFLITVLLACSIPLIGETEEVKFHHKQDIPIIDAHSQFDQFVELDEIMGLLNKGGVSRVILSDRSTQGIERGKELLNLAMRYPDRVTPAVRTKGRGYQGMTAKAFSKSLKEQAINPKYGAIAEVICTHAAMRNRFFELQEDVMIPPDDPRIGAAIELAKEKNWPFLIHIEFRYIGAHREAYVAKFQKLLEGNGSLPIGLMHMGQLEAHDVKGLIERHPNLFFMTSTANTIIVRAAEKNDPRRGWINMFEGQALKPEWRDLMTAYPDRFVLAFDNVFKGQWGPMYLNQIKLWRYALAQLPDAVGLAISHKNAERLWNLPPARFFHKPQ